jgi:hypothetical protein
VLEHPASSNAWAAHGLPSPAGMGWQQVVRDGVAKSAWVCEVWQSAYGHRARKRTWLYTAGEPPQDLRWERPPGTAQVGWFDRIKPSLSKREASATPPEFRDVLLSIAAKSAKRATNEEPTHA